MGTESEFWQDDVSKLKAFGEIDRIEDSLKNGVSDCVYSLRFMQEASKMGWIELKRLNSWPVRISTFVRLPHYSDDQVNFLERWGRSGARAFLLAQVANSYSLFHWKQARAVHEGLTSKQFVNLASVHHVGKFPAGRILRCLTL